MLNLSGKVVLITGGAGGIGSAMVEELLLNGAKNVAIVDLCEETGDKVVKKMIASFGPNKVIFIKTDVTIREELERAFDLTVQSFKQLDIVINNVGIVNETDWKKTVNVNFVSVVEASYLAMLKYLPKYRSGNEGIIVNTASILGLNTLKSTPMYCATKHGLVGFGKSLGSEMVSKKYQVRVLTLCPGFVRTKLIEPKSDKSHLLFPKETQQEIAALNPILQEPERVGKALIEIIRKGKTGSVWVIEDNIPAFEVAEPDRKSMKVISN